MLPMCPARASVSARRRACRSGARWRCSPLGRSIGDVDGELLSFVKGRVADEAQLPEGWSDRLHGSTLAELRSDAARLATTLGIADTTEPARGRGADGRFASGGDVMNAAIRSARGTTIAPTVEPVPVEGTLGAGRGGTNPPRQPNMSDLIREASGRA